MIVLRALAKNPDDRFQTAEEMDAELDRFAQGAGVTAETADAATAVLSGATLSNAPTAIVPPRRPPTAGRPSYRYADPPARRRPVWPWLLALLLVVLAGVAGWYAFGRIQDTLSGSRIGLGAVRRQPERRARGRQHQGEGARGRGAS